MALDIKRFVNEIKETSPNTTSYWANRYNITVSYVNKLAKIHGLIMKYEVSGAKGHDQRFALVEFVRERPNQWSAIQLHDRYNVSVSAINKWKIKYNLKIKKGTGHKKKEALSQEIKHKMKDRIRKYKRITPTGTSYIGNWDSISLQLDQRDTP